jgi:hypothetical protein
LLSLLSKDERESEPDVKLELPLELLKPLSFPGVERSEGTSWSSGICNDAFV